MIFTGQEAPHFVAPSFENDDFGTISLTDYRGKWLILYFYPGDFTFV